VKVNIFENFAFEEIVVLNKRIEVLLKDWDAKARLKWNQNI
jgi:hypothetical protein